MKARTIGPLLMMTAGAAVIFVPSATWVGAGEQEVCDTVLVQPARDNVEEQIIELCDPCETLPAQLGVTEPCIVDTVPETTGVPETTTGAPETTSGGVGSGGGSLPETGSSNLGFIVLGGALVLAGGALLVTGRRTPELS